ncbi:amidase [Rhodococcoides yunnanense]|uniref:amidase n=1 Tax=Rhodococcoides yunnanense TaxID=278209 RepID=UPI000934A4A9|nr:amidase [Rhodococcus yunnanensis]
MPGLTGSLDALSAWTPARVRDTERDLFVKENIEVAGQPFSAGSATRAGIRGGADAECVAAAKAAGFRVIGTTRCDEFAYGCTGETNSAGPCRNPHDLTRIAGGSSSGSAAAVAAGLSRFALGTDTGGSVRIPAALCGVFGFKPSYGSIGTSGVVPLSFSLDHVGIIADSFDALLALWGAYAPYVDGPPVRVGLAAEAEAYESDDVVGAAWASVVDTLSPNGTAPIPGWHEAAVAGRMIQGYEARAAHGHTLVSSATLLHPDVRARLSAASNITEGQYRRAVDSMVECRGVAATQFSDVDVVVLPTVPIQAPLIGDRSLDVRELLLRNTRAANFSGLPALSIPVPSAGLPVGLQVIGPSNDIVLRAGAQIVRALEVTPGGIPVRESNAVRAQTVPIPTDRAAQDCTQ